MTTPSPAQAAKKRLMDDQARLRLQAMRARLAEASGVFESRFRVVLARTVGEAAKGDPRFAQLAERLRGLAGRGSKG